MKQAYLVLAHHQFGLLKKQIALLDDDRNDIFIHIDKKSTFTKAEIESLYSYSQVKGVYVKYRVHWAGFSILKCELYLLKKALKYSDAGYFHLISAQDYPIKPLNNFLEFFNEDNEKNYLEFQHIPFPQWENNTYARFKYFFFFDYMSRGERTRRLNLKFQEFQKKIGIKRNIPNQFEHLYGGSAWFSITREAANVMLNYHNKHRSFYNRLKFTFCPEETYVTTLLVNLLPQNKICNNNLRYIRWVKENGSCPANYGVEHFYLIAQNKGYFARKFDVPVSQDCISLVDKFLLHDSEFKQTETGGWIYNGFLRYDFKPLLNDLLLDYFKQTQMVSIVDMGCGVGYYVASLRRNGFLANGYDANPYTTDLSALVLPQGDLACGVADLTDDLEVEEKFDAAICLDVLQYIPQDLQCKALQNLADLATKAIIISVRNDHRVGEMCTLKTMKLVLERNGFHYNETLSRMLFKSLLSSDVYIFENN